MPFISIDSGEYIFYEDGVYRYVRRDTAGNMILDHVDTQSVTTVDNREFASALSEGRAKILPEDPRSTSTETARPAIAPFNHAPEADRNEALRRRKYVVSVQQLEKRSCEQDIRRKASEVAQKIGDGKVPGARTIRDWRRRLERADNKIEALLPQNARKGNRQSRFPAKVHSLAEKAIKKEYAIQERPTYHQAYCTFTELIRKENHGRLNEVLLPTPSYNAFRDMLQSYDQYGLTSRRYGKRTAKLAYGRTNVGLQTSFPLQRVEVDHQTLDLLALSEQPDGPDRRPILTVTIDHYSRMCTGYVLSFSTGIGTVLECLKRSILLEPTRYDGDGVCLTEESWDCCGVPLSFCFDNGPEFHSTAVTHALFQIGSECEYTRAYTPEHKGIVERFFSTVSMQFCRGIPGFTFSDPKNRGVYQEQSKAALTLEEIDRYFYRWLIDVYGRTPHSVTGEPPLDRFRRGNKERPARMVNRDEMVPFSGQTADRAITNQGIRINNRYYQASELTEIAASRQYATNGKQVTVYASHQDRSRIWLFDPIQQQHIEAHCTQIAAPQLSAEDKAHNKECKNKANASLAQNRAGMRQAAEQKKARKRQTKAKVNAGSRTSEPAGDNTEALGGASADERKEEKFGQIEVDYANATTEF